MLNLEVPILMAIAPSDVTKHFFINVLLIYLQIIIQFGSPNFKEFKLMQICWCIHGKKYYNQTKTTTYILKKGENVGDPSQLNIISNLQANTRIGIFFFFFRTK